MSSRYFGLRQDAAVSIKDLLWAMLLVALGVCMLVPQFRVAPRDSFLRTIGWQGCVLLLIGGLAAIVGGLLTPFHKTKLGFQIGAGLAIVLILITLAMLPRVY